MIKKILRKTSNWRVPVPDLVQAFWLKVFKKDLEKICQNA